jgi:hypothetical protein
VENVGMAFAPSLATALIFDRFGRKSLALCSIPFMLRATVVRHNSPLVVIPIGSS